MATRPAKYEPTEVLHEGARVVVLRARRFETGESVIIKAPRRQITDKALEPRLRNELEILSKLELPGVVRLRGIEEFEGEPTLVYQDIGGEPLDRVAARGPLALPTFLDLAVELVETIGQLHQRRIVHKDINPSHVVWNAETKQLNLIDFGIADAVPERSMTPQRPAELEGTLEYISPEQTGRMNRPVDFRTDLYSLGVTFFQLLTGRLPFTAEDAMGLVHCHLASVPIPPHELDTAIPPAVSRIVLKLMAKMPEDRYQSAFGLLADLERCRRELRERGAIPDFEPGQADFSDRLQIPPRLFGREAEIRRLLDALARARAGSRELLTVGGFAGVGKTAVVRELHRPTLQAGGRFIEGKFDQRQRNIPYSAWIQAFQGLVNALLTDSEEQFARSRESIRQAVGRIGKVLTDVIPNLERVIGPQPEVPALGATEALNRMSHAFVAFVRSVAGEAHPLVIFLDDLQWIDAASLNLLPTLLGTADISHLLVIGAYRDNEVDAVHPLSVSLELLREEQACITRMLMHELPEPTVEELVAEALHLPREEASPLSSLLHVKTGGNPFFLRQLLMALVEKAVVSFDLQEKRWRWDARLLATTEMTENVATLMLGKVRGLPEEAQRILALAACIGFRFEPASVGIIAELPAAAVLEVLQPALREGLVDSTRDGLQFAHDRIQQAAYSLIPEDQKKVVHLDIGRLLLKHLPTREDAEELFTVVDHLDTGADRIADPAERLELARLNLRAGSRARASGAFSAADRYFEAGIAMLDAGCWETDYSLALELHTSAAEASSLVGRFQRTDEHFATVIRHARTAVDTVGVYESRINSHLSHGRIQESLDEGLLLLEQLGMSLPHHPTDADIGRWIAETRSLHASLAIENLVEHARMTDPNHLAIARIASKLGPAAYSGRPKLCLMLILTTVSLAMRHGNTTESPYLYGAYAMLLCGLLGDFATGDRFGQVALTLLEAHDSAAIRSKTLGQIAGNVWHFRRPVRATLPYLEAGFQSGVETGDFEYAGYNALFYCANAFFAGVELTELEPRVAAYARAVQEMHAEIARRGHAIYWQAMKNLMSPAGDPCALRGDCFDEDEMVPLLEEARHAGALARFHVTKLMLCYLFEDYERALQCAASAERNLGGMLAMFPECAFAFYDSLTRLRLHRRGAEEQTALVERVSANQRQLRLLAESAPMNFLHKFQLVEAERRRVAGEGIAVLELYDAAIAGARDNQFVQEEALANELAARFCLERGKHDFAHLYMTRARDRYDAWGAKRKVRDLEERYAGLLSSSEALGTAVTGGNLDLATLMKTAQAISAEIELPRLLARVLRTAVENAGARFGALLREQAGQWVVAARGGSDGSEVEISRPVDVARSEEIARGVVQLVARTSGYVVLDDAAHEGDFVNDPAIRQRRSKSLLCAPLLSRGRLTAILYLENDLATHAFTTERVRLLEVLLSQAATSLENASVYQALRESEAKYRQIVETAAEGVCAVDADGVATMVNSSLAEMVGYAPEEIVGRPVAAFMAPEDWRDHEGRLESRRRGISDRYERRLMHKSGRVVWTLTSAAPMFDEDGRFRGSVCMVTDVTEQKRAAEEIRRLNVGLEKKVAQRTSQLQAANERLEAFSYSVSHDLRAPLRAIEGFAQLLAKHARDRVDPKEQHYLQMIQTSAGRMGQLISDLLRLSRATRAEMAMRTLDMTALTRAVFEEIHEGAPDRKITLVLATLPPALGDPALVRQVLVNLLSNAVKFTAGRTEALIEVAGHTERESVVFSVKDNGAGFDMQYAGRLFGVFQRLHRVEEFDGTGIGLAIVRQIIERHGGHVRAEGAVDRGATFFFSLPQPPAT